MPTVNGLIGYEVATVFAVALLLAPVHRVEEIETFLL